MQAGEPLGHGSMRGGIGHGGLAVPFRIDIIPVGFRGFRRLDIAGVVDEADDRAAIIRAVEIVMRGFVEVLGRGRLILEKHSLVSHDLHGIDAGEKNIPGHLAGAEFIDRPVHHRRRRGAPVNTFDARILLVEARLDLLHHLVLQRAKNSDLPFLPGRFDESFFLPAGKTRNR